MELIQAINNLVNINLLVGLNLLIALSAYLAYRHAKKAKYKIEFKIFPLVIIATIILNVCQLIA